VDRRGSPAVGNPEFQVPGFRNSGGQAVTIRVDSKVVAETDDLEGAKSDESRWMRYTLDTVGKTAWPTDAQGRPVHPEGYAELAAKLERPMHPPGRDIRCIVSVGMLTEGWDCNTVTHIIGLRPFQSQLLCEQVVGRGLRRRDYEIDESTGLMREEVAKVFGVPFEVIPFKANPQKAPVQKPDRKLVKALPAKSHFAITFPRVEGYTQGIRNRIAVDWASVPTLMIDPGRIPPEVEMKALNVNNQGRMSLSGPGRVDEATLATFRAGRRVQELVFELARDLTRDVRAHGHCEIPPHVLFPQLAAIVRRYVEEKVRVVRPADVRDLFCSPYYGWLIERLTEAIRADTSQGEAPELPRYEANRPAGSTAEVSYWTSRDVRETIHCHLNYVVADTRQWEQSAAYRIDRHRAVAAFVKNAGLGFAIPYIYNGERHDYIPDFLIRLKGDGARHLILEVKGFDELEEVKTAAAERWVAAVNADGTYGGWRYAVARKVSEVSDILDAFLARGAG
jgi:type III restriction enzyme